MFKDVLGKSLLKTMGVCKTVILAVTNKARAKTYLSKKFDIGFPKPYNKNMIKIINDYRQMGYLNNL